MRDWMRSYSEPSSPTVAGSSPTTGSSTSPARWSASAASARAAGSAAARPRRRGPAVPPSQGSRGVGARAVPRPANVSNHGERVVHGQRLMQAASDIFLGWDRDAGSTVASTTSTSANSGTESCRRTSKSSSPSRSAVYGQMCGWTLARAPRAVRGPRRDRHLPRLGRHVRSGRRRVRGSRTPDQNQRDFDAAIAARRSGRLVVA